MKQIDAAQAERVWSRVMAAQETSASAPGVQAQTAQELTGGEVLALMEKELEGAATYRCLAAGMRRDARAKLFDLAREECAHAKKLGTIYFLLTGKKPCPKSTPPRRDVCALDTLRRQYHAELAAQETYEHLAARTTDHACALRQIALDECRHAKTICMLVQSCLP